jgi:outer membrane receptor protein involved in Fe transport
LGLNATHVLAYKQQGSSTSPVVSSLGVPGQPVDWRGRAYASLISGRFGGTLGVNYVDSYANPLAPAGQQKIDSWTTVDLILTYDLRRGASKGSRFNLSIQNLLDKNPPHLDPVSGSNIVYPVGFDPANANPLGRFLVLGLTQTW